MSYTTRKKRDYEVEGRHYHFVTAAVFRSMIEKGLFAEWEQVHGDYYGTPKENLERAKREGMDLFLDVDVKGALNIKRMCKEAILVFVLPPSREVLVERLRKRGEKEIERRLRRYDGEVENKDRFDYIIINDQFDEAYERFKELVLRVRREEDGKDYC